MQRRSWSTAAQRPIAPSPAAEMALPFFCERLRDNLGLETLLRVHLLQAPILVFELLHAGHQRRIHAAELGAPLVEGCRTHAMFAAQLGDRGACLGLLEDGDDLAVGKAGSFHAELSKILVWKILLSNALIWRGDYQMTLPKISKLDRGMLGAATAPESFRS